MSAFEERLHPALSPAEPLASARLCVAFSGGADSTALLAGLAALRERHGFALRAAHVDHGLHPQSASWAAHCRQVCERLDVPLAVFSVKVAARGRGPEAAARDARYGALAATLSAGEWLLTAHHRDDQLETLLLHLARGSGVSGLAGIPAQSQLGAGRLLRPCLDFERDSLCEYTRLRGLPWIEDPSNQQPRFDRNFLRGEIIPRLKARFPAIDRAASRSAALMAEAAGLLEERAAEDAVHIASDGLRIDLPGLAELSEARQRNLIRHLARRRAMPMPPEARLREGLAQMLHAAPDRNPVIRWPGGELRRYRRQLYLLEPVEPGRPRSAPLTWDGQGVLEPGGSSGRLHLEPDTGRGLSRRLRPPAFTVTFAPLPGAGTTLKHVFQGQGVVPWMRGHVPLLLAGGRLVAVADLWLAPAWRARPREAGDRIVWDRHPALN